MPCYPRGITDKTTHMTLKAPQNEPNAPVPMPTAYDDDLAARCFPLRFRRIGSPFAYLNDVGITPILEFIYKGNLLIDVAEAVNVPLTTLRTWVENEGHLQAIEEAETISAEGYLAEGLRRLRNAPTEFELRRAKEMVKHAHYMASKKNKPIYGESAKITPNAPVTYIFNVPDSKHPLPGQVIDSTSNRIEKDTADYGPTPVSMDLGTMFGLGHVPMAEDVPAQEPKREPQLRLVADRPARPTPQDPDIGPFFEEVP